MSVEVTWIGLDELRAALRRLPTELTGKAATIISASAVATVAELKEAYPDETGNLRKGVRIKKEKARTPFTVREVVASTARHATLYERGTQTRQTKLGYNRGNMFSQQLGAAPRQGANVFIPIVERRRRAMFEDLVQVVAEAGLDVRR